MSPEECLSNTADAFEDILKKNQLLQPEFENLVQAGLAPQVIRLLQGFNPRAELVIVVRERM
jgi:hypothetical protein